MLALAEIEERHDSSFLVLGGVALEDLVDDYEVLGREFEGDGGVVVGRVAVLKQLVSVEVYISGLGVRRTTREYRRTWH